MCLRVCLLLLPLSLSSSSFCCYSSYSLFLSLFPILYSFIIHHLLSYSVLKYVSFCCQPILCPCFLVFLPFLIPVAAFLCVSFPLLSISSSTFYLSYSSSVRCSAFLSSCFFVFPFLFFYCFLWCFFPLSLSSSLFSSSSYFSSPSSFLKSVYVCCSVFLYPCFLVFPFFLMSSTAFF